MKTLILFTSPEMYVYLHVIYIPAFKSISLNITLISRYKSKVNYI